MNIHVYILQDYLAFKAELDRRETVYKKLAEKCLAKKAVKITEQMLLMYQRSQKLPRSIFYILFQ